MDCLYENEGTGLTQLAPIILKDPNKQSLQ